MTKKRKSSRLMTFFSKLGPGLITGASDDDPSGIATYSQAGAQFGLATLWTALITFPLMAIMQAICARIGMAASAGLIYIIKEHYPKPLLYLIVLLSFPAIVLNIGADIAGMGAVANLVFPQLPSYVFSIAFTLLLMPAIVFLSYKKLTAVLKYLCLSLLLYLIVPFLVKQNWMDVLKHTFIPTLHFNKEFISILVAILGTTISPYLFFWQATMEAENKHQEAQKLMVVDKRTVKDVGWDVSAGMLTSNLVMYFIILTTGTILFQGGIHHIETVEQAAKALEPLAGKLSYLLFAFGIIGTGLIAIPVLSGCLSYMLTTAFNWQGGLDRRLRQAKAFYLIIALSLLLGLAINFIGLSPIRALLITAMLYGITAPVLILIVMHIAQNKKIMGSLVNGWWFNILGYLAFLLMAAAALLLLYFQFFG